MSTAMEMYQVLSDAIPFTGPEFVEFYSKSLRGSLFSGFLTLSGFLFSINTFIIVNMKKELYDHEKYQEDLDVKRALNPNLTVYGPLRRLSQLLIIATAGTVTTSVLQFTVGLIPRWYTAALALLAAPVALGLVVRVLVVIQQNLRALFIFLEDQALKKAKERQIKAQNGRDAQP